MASELKMASAFFLDSRSPISSSVASGRPMRARRATARARPSGVVGAIAAGLGGQDALAGVPEVRGVRPLDADAPVTRALSPRSG